jgi:hypothetical protein
MCDLSDGVMVTQRPLEALFMVRIHVGQPLQFFNNYNGFMLFTRQIMDQSREAARTKKEMKNGIFTDTFTDTGSEVSDEIIVIFSPKLARGLNLNHYSRSCFNTKLIRYGR